MPAYSNDASAFIGFPDELPGFFERNRIQIECPSQFNSSQIKSIYSRIFTRYIPYIASSGFIFPANPVTGIILVTKSGMFPNECVKIPEKIFCFRRCPQVAAILAGCLKMEKWEKKAIMEKPSFHITIVAFQSYFS